VFGYGIWLRYKTNRIVFELIAFKKFYLHLDEEFRLWGTSSWRSSYPVHIPNHTDKGKSSIPGSRLPLLSARPAVTFPAAEHHRPLVGTHSTVPRKVEGWVDLGGWLHTKIRCRLRESNPDTVTHPSTNRAQRALTSLIEVNALPLRQTTIPNHARDARASRP